MYDLHAEFVQMRANIMRDGWYQGSAFKYSPDVGPACIMGHIQRVSLRQREMSLAFIKYAGIYRDSIPLWNDSPYRTLRQVIDAVDKCIAATAPVPVVNVNAHDANLLA